jgi:hypothetical protein
MAKYIGIAILALLVAGSWYMFDRSGDEVRDMEKQVAKRGRASSMASC